jgi:uncharacterized membrane-anchored protein
MLAHMVSIPKKQGTLAKVPAITLGFWIIKILATTLGETGGDRIDETQQECTERII